MESFTRDGLTFEVADSGPPGGDVVVLLHGFPQFASSWERVTARLNEAGYRTLAPNQRGYSLGARPEGRRAYVMPELVRDVVALIDAVGVESVHLVGHDWGAAVAWSFAAAIPERVRTLSALSVPHPAAFRSAMFTSRQLLASYYMFLFQLPWLPEQVLRFPLLLRTWQQDAELARRDVQRLNEIGWTGPLNWYRAIPLTNPRRITRAVRVPTLYVWSDRDRPVTRAAAERCDRYVDAPFRFEVLRGVSHWQPQEAWAPVAQLLTEHLSG